MDDIEAEGDSFRCAIIQNLRMIGVNEAALAAELQTLLTQGEDMAVKSKAVDQILALTAAIPRRTQRVKIDSTQRSLHLTLGNGSLGSVDLGRVAKLPPEERQQAVRLLARLQEEDEPMPATTTTAEPTKDGGC